MRKARTPSFDGLKPASEAASRSKRANRKTDTLHEVLLRKTLWSMGLRYRKNVRSLPGIPDLVFGPARVAVFCDGDFWHGRHWERLQQQLRHRHNADYWIAKIRRNRERDIENTRQLLSQGWLVIRLWETDIRANPTSTAEAIRKAVQNRLTPDASGRT